MIYFLFALWVEIYKFFKQQTKNINLKLRFSNSIDIINQNLVIKSHKKENPEQQERKKPQELLLMERTSKNKRSLSKDLCDIRF